MLQKYSLAAVSNSKSESNSWGMQLRAATLERCWEGTVETILSLPSPEGHLGPEPSLFCIPCHAQELEGEIWGWEHVRTCCFSYTHRCAQEPTDVRTCAHVNGVWLEGCESVLSILTP